jgi:hypothetical protein
MGKTARSSDDAQHKAHKDLARLVMIGTLGLIELSALELFNQSNPSQKLDQNRQASKGGDRSECVAEFDLSSTKKGPNPMAAGQERLASRSEGPWRRWPTSVQASRIAVVASVDCS